MAERSAWRSRLPAFAVAGLSVALLATSFAPWWGWRRQGLSFLPVPTFNAWQESGLWIGAVVLGLIAGALALLRHRAERVRWAAVAALTLVALVLVVLPIDPPCRCGLPADNDYGWFAYAPLNAPVRPGNASLWGRYLAAVVLAAQLVVAAIGLRPRRT